MSTDQLLARLREWRHWNYGPQLPRAVVIAERDWTSYVLAMAEAVPATESLDFPTEEDVLWSWPEGVLVVFSEPLAVDHTIISHTKHGPLGEQREDVPAHVETQLCRALSVMSPRVMPARSPDGRAELPDVPAYPIVWIGEDPSDIISGHWMPGFAIFASELGTVSFSTRLLLSIVTALGHRLTRLDAPGATRGERRRIQRDLPLLRVLQLASGASVSSRGGSVEWTRRWMVRGHWRLQPYGPGRAQRKPIWIDPYVKGPDDKPLDTRPTAWRATC